MLHLVFSKDGLDRIKAIIRPNDQVVQLTGERILLLDTMQCLDTIRALPKNGKISEHLHALEGEVIDQGRLASIISSAPSINSTY